MPESTTFAEVIRSLREQRGWSVYRLAEESGVPRQYLGKLESGDKADPSARVLLRVARALGVSLAAFDGCGPTA